MRREAAAAAAAAAAATACLYLSIPDDGRLSAFASSSDPFDSAPDIDDRRSSADVQLLPVFMLRSIGLSCWLTGGPVGVCDWRTVGVGTCGTETMGDRGGVIVAGTTSSDSGSSLSLPFVPLLGQRCDSST
uniref:Uncharacterized protein n=1 Tax=Anopheles farauti TaxID=69004 RepID=A0A182QBL5_9DIPT